MVRDPFLECPVTVLLVLILVGALVGVGLCIEMNRRNHAILGLSAIAVLMAVAVLSTVYAALVAE